MLAGNMTFLYCCYIQYICILYISLNYFSMFYYCFHRRWCWCCRCCNSVFMFYLNLTTESQKARKHEVSCTLNEMFNSCIIAQQPVELRVEYKRQRVKELFNNNRSLVLLFICIIQNSSYFFFAISIMCVPSPLLPSFIFHSIPLISFNSFFSFFNLNA